MKAHQSRRLTYQDIQILSPPQKDGRSQAPIAMVRPKTGDWEFAQIIPMSISHDGEFATAVCMACENSPASKLPKNRKLKKPPSFDDLLESVPENDLALEDFIRHREASDEKT